jgi:hypothetical protein
LIDVLLSKIFILRVWYATREEIALKLALVAIAIIFHACLSQADSINVCPNGCKYETIQSAVYAAKTNDTIVVSSWTYNESVFLTKSLKFVKNDSEVACQF